MFQTLDWYGEGKRAVKICTATALWYRFGCSPLTIRSRPRHPRSFQRIRHRQLSRLSRLLRAMERGRVLLRKAVRSWDPDESDSGLIWPLSARPRCCVGLYSLVTLFGHALHPDGNITVAQSAWYRKLTATFRDVFTVMRRHM